MPEASQPDVAATTTRLRNIRNVPPGVKGALIADAARESRSINDVALCILAERFETDCPEEGNRSRSQPTLSDQLQLRIPHYHPLWGAFWAAAREWQTTESSVVIKVLSDHYALPYDLVRRGRKPKAAIH